MKKEIEDKIQSWLNGPYDEKTKEEIRRLFKEDPKALEEAFFKDLSFGTGGMRGIMGIGTNRLNIYTIQMATQGLANYINLQKKENPKVFIGYDVRHHSQEFAKQAAFVLAGNEITPLFSKEICPTPLVSFACRHFGCTAAIMITASHNPPIYNGYKVYWEDGAQVVYPHDQGIIEEVKKVTTPTQVRIKKEFQEIQGELDEAYFEKLKTLKLSSCPPSLQIVYSNLHGTGIRLMEKALSIFGHPNFSFVEKQKALDGNFTNAPSPNPEEPKAMQMGIEMMKKEGKDLFLATDPDADRIGVAIDGYRFNGNEMACICLDYICKELHAQKKFPKKGAFVKSIVTTELFRKIAEANQGTCFDVLTGFKYIGELIEKWEKNNHPYQYIFGAEESYGSLMGTFVRDKDAISSACIIADIAAKAKERGETLKDCLHSIYKTYGVHRTSLKSIKFEESQSGMEKMKQMMQEKRDNPPKEFNNIKVILVEDFLQKRENFPLSNVLLYRLEDGTKIVLRPSGTEPKLKIYVEVAAKVTKSVEEEIQSCDQKLEELLNLF